MVGQIVARDGAGVGPQGGDHGYDEHHAHLVDTEQQGGAVSTSLASLGRARAARGPMTAKHRSFTLAAPVDPVSPRSRIVPAVTACADAFLDPPIANLGHQGSADLRTGHGLYAEAATGWTETARLITKAA